MTKVDGRRLYFIGHHRGNDLGLDSWRNISRHHGLVYNEVHENLSTVPTVPDRQGVFLEDGRFFELRCREERFSKTPTKKWLVTRYFVNPGIETCVMSEVTGQIEWKKVCPSPKLFSSIEEAVAFLYAVGVHIPNEVPVSSDL